MRSFMWTTRGQDDVQQVPPEELDSLAFVAEDEWEWERRPNPNPPTHTHTLPTRVMLTREHSSPAV